MIEHVDLTRVRFDPELLLTSLAQSGVAFVVIGGIAAILHGDIEATGDADTTVQASQENLELLAEALRNLDARLLVTLNDSDVAAIDVPITAATFSPLTSGRFLTKYGVLDVVLRPDGVPDYEQWAEDAGEVALESGATVLVASLDDIIRSKAAADRPKDHDDLPRLKALRRLLRTSNPRVRRSPDQMAP